MASLNPKRQALDPGRFNRRIQIQQQATTPGPLGQPSSTWTTIYTCWANITEVRAQLLYQTSEFVEKVTRKITIRWTSSVVIQPNMRIVFAQTTPAVTHIYNIESIVDPSESHEQLQLFCYELNASE
jgi:SPP1 family predicted phage head-tail adaptor